jgi:uncharacterized integral membrane protein
LFLLFIIVVFSSFLFTVNNAAEVSLWLGITLSPRPLGLWLLFAFSVGALLGLLLGFGLWRRVQLKLQVRQLTHRLKSLEKQLSIYRQHSGTSTGKGPE